MNIFTQKGRTLLVAAVLAVGAAWLAGCGDKVVDPAAGGVVISTFVDGRDGTTYKKVNIGGQTWMAENLNYNTEESWCYNDIPDSCAKFFIGAILGCEVLSLTPAVIERTKIDKDNPALTLFRMDFAATIKTESGEEKRVLIEMQKAKQLADIYRFREYPGTEYISSALPIISIYILGFNLSVDSAAFGSFPDCRDLRTGQPLSTHDPFVEKLTHTAYFVQTKRITPSLNTRLDKLLSIFEQANFVNGSGETTKDYALSVDDPELKETIDILRYAAADMETRKELDKEAYYQRSMVNIFGESDRKFAEAIQQKDEALRREEEAKQREEEALQQKEEALQREEVAKQREEEANRRQLQTAHDLKYGEKLPAPRIAKLTGLSEAEIEAL